MDYWLGFIFMFLQIVTFSSTDQVDLEKEPTSANRWIWTVSRPAGSPLGWYRDVRFSGLPFYTTCSIDKQPNSWLRNDPLITVPSAVKKVHIAIDYKIKNCSQFRDVTYCREYFDLYVHQSGQTTIPNPLTNNATYEKIAKITASTLDISVTKTIGVDVKGKYLELAFHDQGSCSVLYSVTVSYYVCSESTLDKDLVSLPRTMASANNSEPVLGNCVTNAVHDQGILSVNCQNNGAWNISSLKGRCVCKEDMENTGGQCKDCPDGKYNDQKGLNCTVLPSAPRNVHASFVNQTALEIQWLPPAIVGDQTQLFYDVDCSKPCSKDDGNECVDQTCGDDVIFVPYKDGLNMTQVIITNLSSFLKYTIKVYARNRVSELAQRKHGIKGTFTAITVRTNGSVPGKPEVSVEQPETSVVVSWTLKEKNGVIKEYHVTYIREDDSSETETVTTKKMRVHFDLMAGKTYEFQVFAVNNIGKGPAGVMTFTLRNASPTKALRTEDSKVATHLKVIYGLVGLLVLCIMSFVCYILCKRWRGRRNANQTKIPKTKESSIMVYDNVAMSSVAEYQNVDGFGLDRDQITTIRVLGSGNFGQVFKAVYEPSRAEVAVKSLKDNATKKDLQDMLTELDVMKSLQPHPHVVRLIGCCVEKEPPLIILEYLPYGDLLGYLRKSRGMEDTYNTGEKRPNSTLSEKDLLSFAWMIADGMNYLSTMKIVHRDLAARNVLVGDKKVCKISDFGLARGLEGDIYTRKTQARLPVKWMPPESLFYGTSTTMSDIWSYGIVMWEVFTIGESPYPGLKSRQIAGLLQTGYRMPRPAHISQELYFIMTKCWEEQPQKRPTFQWLCSEVKRLLDDQKVYVNLEVYDGKDYVNFDVMTDKE